MEIRSYELNNQEKQHDFFFLQIDNKSIKIFSQNEFFWKKNVFNVRK